MPKDRGGFALCIKNEGYEASLEIRKIYRVIPDPEGEAKSLVRIVDESGEDYLFPADFFVPIQVPAEATVAFEGSGWPAPAEAATVAPGWMTRPGKPIGEVRQRAERLDRIGGRGLS